MTKIVINDSDGIRQEAGSGTRIDSNISGLATAQIKNAFYSNPDTITAAASAAQLDSRPLQLMVIVNVDSGQDVVVRNFADDETLATLGEGKIGIFVSTATGDNWAGSQVD
jgi:hypothetical protein